MCGIICYADIIKVMIIQSAIMSIIRNSLII